jgi:ketosteroid isomerase-like protein
MTETRLREFFDAWNGHDAEAAMIFFAEDCAYLASFGPEPDGTAFRGRDAVADGVRRFLATFPDAHYRDLEVFPPVD